MIVEKITSKNNSRRNTTIVDEKKLIGKRTPIIYDQDPGQKYKSAQKESQGPMYHLLRRSTIKSLRQFRNSILKS